MLSLAEHSGAYSENAFLILISHDGESFGSDYESCVDESIDVGGFLVDGEVSRWGGGYL